MPLGRPKPPLLLRPEESEQLRSVAASRTLPHLPTTTLPAPKSPTKTFPSELGLRRTIDLSS